MRQTPDKLRELAARLKGKMNLRSLVLTLAVLVVFTTTYLLILPAFTLDKDEAAEQGGIDVVAVETVAEEAKEDAAVETADVKEEVTAETKEEADKTDAKDVDVKEETSEKKAETKSEEKSDVKLLTKKTTINADQAKGDNFAVSAVVGKDAKVPADVTITATELDKTTDGFDYDQYKKDALKALKKDSSDVKAIKSIKFYDISLESDSQENSVEPSAPVNVKIAYEDGMKVDNADNIRIVHFAEQSNGEVKPEVLDTEKNKVETVTNEDGSKLTEASFDTDGFSVYAIVGTELYTEITLPGSSDTYVVTVTAPAEARIPQGSTLRVEPFEEGSKEYEYARNAVLADKKEKGEFVDIDNFGLAALDISIIDPDGDEIEPSAAVQVDIKIKELPGVDDLSKIKDSLEIQHHVEVEDGVVVENVFNGSDEGVFQMDTNEKVVEGGTAVDPTSVSDEDFRVEEEVSTEIDASFDTEVFSTFTISWNNANGNGVTIHYVDENGTELTVANSVFPTTIGSNSSSPAHLIYDIDGYEYDHTYRRYYQNNRWNEQDIVAELTRNNQGWRYSTNGNNWNNLSASNAQRKDEIYVVYKKKADVTQGGSPTLKPVKPEDYPDEPSILKESDPNGDGTADLSLSITGHTKDREVEKLADVIVVFDVSGSMDYNLSGNTKRLAAAKTAVNNLVDNLATKKNSDGNPLVRMSLISFSNTATNVIGLTDLTTQGVSDYKGAVRGLSAGGGTNWDYALQLANEQAVDSGRATFVIFVTDGDPTFRNTRTNINDSNLNSNNNSDVNNSYYLDYNVFGTGIGDNRGNNYDAAVTQGQAIVAANKNLYTIGISNDVTKVSNFNTDAGGEGAYIAADAAALNQAFADIEAAIIAKLGFSDIEMTDGITEMTQTVDKSGLTTTDGSFTYWKKAKDATDFVEWDPASEGAQEAEYDEASGAVKWDMGTNFMPEDGATYKVTWKVWPSQEAYDILAKCKNDPSFYDTLTDAQKAQITRTGTSPNYSYTLRTNEPGAGTTYKSATKSGSGITTEGEDKFLEFNQVDPLGLASSQISIKKIWDNQLDDREITGSYDFPVKAGDTDFGAVTLSSSQNPKWQNTFYISPGLMTTNPYVVYEHGHDYTIEEPSDLSYQWDFKSDVYHPMVINNQTKILIKVDTQAESDYTIDGKYYKELSGETVLTATNERRSNLNISKTVVDKDGNHIESDQAFTFTVTVDEGHDDEVWLSAYDTIAGETVKDSSIVTGNGVQYQESDGYFHAPSGTTLTLKLKDGWNYRFTNLSVGSTYSIEENSPVPDGYTFANAVATATNGATAGTVTGQKTEGTIDKSNSVYTTAYTNRANTTTLKLRKVDEDGTTPLAGAVIEIVKDSSAIDGSPFTTTTEDIELTLFDGIYRVKETASPSGYVILNGEMYFKTVNGTVTITDQDGNEKAYDDFTMETENGVVVLKLKNHPGNELPHTGGSGTLPYTLGGIALIMASALMYGFRMRRRERRLN